MGVFILINNLSGCVAGTERDTKQPDYIPFDAESKEKGGTG